MRGVSITIFLFVVFWGIAIAADDRSKTECVLVKEKIKKVQSKMRAGYSRAQGEKLEAQLRKLKSRRKEVCR